MDAPWDHYAYLSTYPTVASPEPGDVVVYPDGAACTLAAAWSSWPTMRMVWLEPIPWIAIGTPVGFARPLVEPSNRRAVDPAAVPVDQTKVDRRVDPATIPVDQTMVDPALADPGHRSHGSISRWSNRWRRLSIRWRRLSIRWQRRSIRWRCQSIRWRRRSSRCRWCRTEVIAAPSSGEAAPSLKRSLLSKLSPRVWLPSTVCLLPSGTIARRRYGARLPWP